MLKLENFIFALLLFQCCSHWWVSPCSGDDASDSPCSTGSPPSRGRYKGGRTICVKVKNCSDLNEVLDLYRIYPEHPDWGSIVGPIGVAFVKNVSQNSEFIRETDIVRKCGSISGPGIEDHPSWALEPSNQNNLRSHLETHCFTRYRFAGNARTFPFKTLYRVTAEGGDQNTVYKKEAVAHVIPNDKDYWVLRGKSDIDEICTCWLETGCKRLGQMGLVQVTNLTVILRKLAG